MLRAMLLALMLGGAQRAWAQGGKDEAGWGRRGGGVVAGSWHVGAPEIARAVQPTYRRSLLWEAYFRRGLSEHLALESSLSYWRRSSERPDDTGGTDTTRVSIVPLLTSLRIYPFTTARNLIEPYLLGGAGLAISLQQDPEGTLAGDSRNVSFGFGVKAGIGVEVHAYGPIGLTLGGHYQGVRFGQAVDEQEAFGGTGVQGGVSYRFNF